MVFWGTLVSDNPHNFENSFRFKVIWEWTLEGRSEVLCDSGSWNWIWTEIRVLPKSCWHTHCFHDFQGVEVAYLGNQWTSLSLLPFWRTVTRPPGINKGFGDCFSRDMETGWWHFIWATKLKLLVGWLWMVVGYQPTWFIGSSWLTHDGLWEPLSTKQYKGIGTDRRNEFGFPSAAYNEPNETWILWGYSILPGHKPLIEPCSFVPFLTENEISLISPFGLCCSWGQLSLKCFPILLGGKKHKNPINCRSIDISVLNPSI